MCLLHGVCNFKKGCHVSEIYSMLIIFLNRITVQCRMAACIVMDATVTLSECFHSSLLILFIDGN
jgi:hypothetical protein